MTGQWNDCENLSVLFLLADAPLSDDLFGVLEKMLIPGSLDAVPSRASEKVPGTKDIKFIFKDPDQGEKKSTARQRGKPSKRQRSSDGDGDGDDDDAAHVSAGAMAPRDCPFCCWEVIGFSHNDPNFKLEWGITGRRSVFPLVIQRLFRFRGLAAMDRVKSFHVGVGDDRTIQVYVHNAELYCIANGLCCAFVTSDGGFRVSLARSSQHTR